MSALFPPEWLVDPPRNLVVGDGSYAAALALVLCTGPIDTKELALATNLEDEIGVATPQVLSELEVIFLISDGSQSVAEILTVLRNIWEMVKRLSLEESEHRLALIFVLPHLNEDLVASLALGLGLKEIEPETSGHAVAAMRDGLKDLFAIADRVVPRDAVALQNRINKDRRHGAIAALKQISPDHRNAYKQAANEVLAAFEKREYDLDQFCRPPCHPNGNAVRRVLHGAVTNVVTPDEWQAMLSKLT